MVHGGISDLSILTQAASVPPEIIDKAADELTSGIRDAAGLFAEVAEVHAGAIRKISDEHRLMRSHDLTGAVFQRLIADRKFLAAYYTTPPSAALLAGLAIRQGASPAGKPWSDTEALKHMRIADFACGTGTLLSAAYQRL